MNSNSSRSSNETFDFTDDEIRHELSKLGYSNIREDQFDEFKRDLMTLAQAERSGSFNSSNSMHSAKDPVYDFNRIYEPIGQDKPRKSASLYDKENPNSRYSLPTSTRDRYPLRITSNTAHVAPSSSRKPASYYYRPSTIDAGAKSLPIRQSVTVSDYYTPLDDLSPPRQRSADFSESRCKVDDYYINDSVDTSSLAEVRHLDDYWKFKSAEARDRPRVADYEDAADRKAYVADDVTDSILCEEMDSKLNLSRASQSSIVKRKVSKRMADGSARVFEESYMKDDDLSDAASDRGECDIGDVAVRTTNPATYPPEKQKDFSRYPYRQKPVSARYDKTVDPVLSAVIWPESKPITSKNSTARFDPVNRYQQYQQEWSRSKVPEEKKHKGLRWAIREQMLYKDIIYEKPQKTYVQNKYVVPTDKKRKELRWRVRADMAAGLMPGGL